jgi:hypothetical protein
MDEMTPFPATYLAPSDEWDENPPALCRQCGAVSSVHGAANAPVRLRASLCRARG